MNTTDSQLIVWRFFQALEMLKATRRIRGLQTFTRRYGINRRNLGHLGKEMASGIFQPAWLSYLVRDYGLSAHWLLTGEGDMLQPQPLPQPKRGRGRPRKSDTDI